MTKQESTCFEGCRYRDKKGNFRKTCPDYFELSWKSETGEICVTEDCARRRTLLMMLNMDTRLVGVQKASEQERNATHRLTDVLSGIAQGQKAGDIIEMKRID